MRGPGLAIAALEVFGIFLIVLGILPIVSGKVLMIFVGVLALSVGGFLQVWSQRRT